MIIKKTVSEKILILFKILECVFIQFKIRLI